MHFRRYFLVEPNLKKSYGHVMEFPFALQNFLKVHNAEVYVISNKDIDKSLLKALSGTYPFISQGCFDDLSDAGESYYEDLNMLDKQFKFNSNDLVINLTSYTNQILGVSKYLNQHSVGSPIFCLWFHQIYPPTKTFTETLSFTFRKQAHQRLANSFYSLKETNNIHLFTTLSDGLQNAYVNFSEQPVNRLPLPYSKINTSYYKRISKNLTFGFLGDGRYEKGLLLILEYIKKSKDYTNHFILENIFPRGYSDSDLKKLDSLESEINDSHTNVEFIKEPLSNQSYKNIFSRIDVILLPYHPKSYDKRVSGVFIEATMNRIPIITSSRTWMAEQIKQNKKGVVFEYNLGIDGLKQAIKNISTNINTHKKHAIVASKKYKQLHSPEKFMQSLLEFLN